jgi:hypothetical protein
MHRELLARRSKVRIEELNPQVSVLVPVTDQADPLVGLYEEYSAPLRAAGIPFEFLFLVEPSEAALAEPLLSLSDEGEPVRVLEFGQNISLSSLLQSGAFHATAPVVLTIPPYRRVEARALLDLIATVRTDVDMVVVRRWPRRDSRFSRLQNRVFNRIISQGREARFHDVACGVRAMRRQVLLDLPIYGDFVNFLPLFALREGYRVVEIDAPQHSADVRSGVFGPGVYLRRIVDILGLYFLLYFTEKPLRFFGTVGAAVSGVGTLLLLLVIIQRFEGQPLADRPFLVLAVMLIVLGFQSIALGLIGEIVVHLRAPSRAPYRSESHDLDVSSSMVTASERIDARSVEQR